FTRHTARTSHHLVLAHNMNYWVKQHPKGMRGLGTYSHELQISSLGCQIMLGLSHNRFSPFGTQHFDLLAKEIC
ncbi:hypothetical protein ACJX0J_022174, partial [Zea mays]